jgi:hypothetical protein
MPPLTLPELEQKVLSNPTNTNLNNWWNAAIEAQLICFEAQNEQHPLGSLLKCSVRPMQLKSESKHQQVGDYVFKIKNTWCRIVFERKSVPDLYSTLFMTSANGEKNRDRLKREIQRFYDDTRFNNDNGIGSFVIVCEGSYQEYMNYLAPRKACKHCVHWHRNPTGDQKIGLCSNINYTHPNIKIKLQNENCALFADKESDKDRILQMSNARKAAIDSLNSMPQVQVLFCESREDMAERIESIVKLWSFHNFEEVLK